jgi:hypothetical protein
MKIHDVAQQSVEWMIARSGIVTASELDAIITPLWKARTGEGVLTYQSQKIAEQWIGGPLPSVQGIFDLEQGKILEEEAKPFFTVTTGEEIRNVGFITTDDNRAGCSPDGLLGDDCGIEIKCPQMTTHIRYLLENDLPKQYSAQVHGSMFVTGYKRWKFMSYRRNFPPLILTIQCDDDIQDKIAEALDVFLEQMDDSMRRLIALNGGPPNPRNRGLAPFPAKYTAGIDIAP